MQTFVNSENEEEYIVRVKSQNLWWLWLLLLLLLPLLLLLRFDKDVALQTVENGSKEALQNVDVSFKYIDYSFIKVNPFGFFVSDTIKLDGQTDQNGKLTFTKVNYSLFSILFHSGAGTEILSSKDCHTSDRLTPRFSTLQDYAPFVIPLSAEKTSLAFLVVDKDDNEPLPEATVKVLVEGQEFEIQTLANGMAEIPGVSRCSDLTVCALKEGFSEDTLKADISTFLQGEYNRTLRLKPEKGVVSFIVQDSETRLSIPGAKATLVLDGKEQSFTTNTDGVGKGFFEGVSAKDKFRVDVAKLSYYDTSSKQYKLTEYKKLKDGDRIIFIRPQKNNMVFRNLDSLSGRPMEGVVNKIFINGEEKGEAYSNRQGCFTVGNIGKNDEVKIVSSKFGIKTKTWVRKGEKITANQNTRDIKLQYDIMLSAPNPRRNCGVHFSGTLLSDKEVKGHISKIYVPDVYGEYVGAGKYVSNQAAFPKAVQYTFDAIAVDKGTHLRLYSEPNFKGKVLLDVQGPALINNVRWKDEARIKDFKTRDFSPELEANYPKSCRRWSETNMNAWDFGSCEITCE